MRILMIIALSLLVFAAEFILFNLTGWLKPNLLLLLIVFLNLYFGIRYSLIAAVAGGFLRDCFSIEAFGFNMVILVFCAYMTVFIKQYLDFLGSHSSRVMIAFILSIVAVLTTFIGNAVFSTVEFRQAFFYVMVPEVLATTILASFVFHSFRKFMRLLAV